LDKTNPQTAESAELENALLAATQQGHEDFLAFLMGEAEQPVEVSEAQDQQIDNSRIRLLDHATFFERGYQTLKDQINGADWHPIQKTQNQFIFTPPKELARRLGMPGADSEVVFGATAIPDESWPDDLQLRLTTDPTRVDNAIKAAMAQKGQWSKELLLTEHHPVMQWLAERLMMLQPRGEAPLIVSPYLEEGELLFCFIGQVSSRAGTPLIVDPHAVSFRKGGRYELRPLRKALEEVKFEQLANSGKSGKLPEKLLEGFIASAVDQSRLHMKKLKNQRQQLIKPRLEDEEKRLKHWFERWATHIEAALTNLPPEGIRATRLRQKREEMEKYLQDRLDTWEQTYYRASDEPTTRLVLVVEGVK
jgi:hypothetical protein